jgi:glycosyltransferase involved in cell wall biosynthesis
MVIAFVGYVGFRPERGTCYHLSRALARHVPVVYLNPLMSLKDWLTWRREIASYSLPDVEIQVLSAVAPGALRFIPKRWRVPLRIAIEGWRSLLRLRQISSYELVLWATHSETALWLHRVLRPALTCYHRVDDFGAMNPTFIPLERSLAQIADLIFAVSPHLQAQHQRQGRDAILLPNAVDIRFFAQALNSPTEIPPDLSALPPPRIGFIGWLYPKWIDIELVLELAHRRPHWSFVMIGPKVDWHPRDLPPNFHLLGQRPYHQLPAYLKGLDVCLVPFKDNAITLGASPLKLYEYLAAGRAVVSTPVPDLPNFAEVVWCARDVEGFIRCIEEALPVAHDPVLQQRRIEAIAPHTWEARARYALEHIQNALQARRDPASCPSIGRDAP